jgi:hypothetical protein
MEEHLVNATREVIKGTMNENDFYFYHTTLSQMMCNKKKQMMTHTGHIKHWILPLKDLNAGTIYRKLPPGDSPELMPLDTSLFNDVHHCVNRHVMITDGRW